MSMKLKVKKGDTVQIIAGADKGKKGAVLSLDKKKLKIKVPGVAVKTHFDEQEGLKQLESFIDYSNVKFVSAATAAKKAKKKAASKSK